MLVDMLKSAFSASARMMYEAGKATPIAREMTKYKLALLGLCETRWTKSGLTKLSFGDMVIYPGHEENNAPHTQGVALLLSKEAQRALISWEPINAMITKAKFKTIQCRIKHNIIQSKERSRRRNKGELL